MGALSLNSLCSQRTLRPRGLVVSVTNFSREELGLDYSGGVGLTVLPRSSARLNWLHLSISIPSGWLLSRGLLSVKQVGPHF